VGERERDARVSEGLSYSGPHLFKSSQLSCQGGSLRDDSSARHCVMANTVDDF
jgi:hypothetical protein